MQCRTIGGNGGSFDRRYDRTEGRKNLPDREDERARIPRECRSSCGNIDLNSAGKHLYH